LPSLTSGCAQPAHPPCAHTCVHPCIHMRAPLWGGAGRVRQGRRNGLLPVHAMRSLTFVCVAGALLILSLVATGGFLPRAVRAPQAAVQRGPCNERTTTTTPATVFTAATAAAARARSAG
jgi:hypothetical protein